MTVSNSCSTCSSVHPALWIADLCKPRNHRRWRSCGMPNPLVWSSHIRTTYPALCKRSMTIKCWSPRLSPRTFSSMTSVGEWSCTILTVASNVSDVVARVSLLMMHPSPPATPEASPDTDLQEKPATNTVRPATFGLRLQSAFLQ